MQDRTGKASRRSRPRLMRGYFPYIWLFIGLFVLYLIISPFVTIYGIADEPVFASSIISSDATVRTVMAAIIFLLLAVAAILLINRRMNTDKALFLVIAVGLVLRFGYMLYTPFFAHGHDISAYDGYGHLSYIWGLFEGRGLPDSFWGQYYHPPFAHAAGAAVARVFAFLTGETRPDTIMESVKLVPCFASCALLFVSHLLLSELNFSKRAKLIAMSIIAFHPTFILLSASINNDTLMIFFFMTAFLYTIRWYKDPTYKNILLLALSIGFAMSTKFSGALIAFLTAAVFLIGLMRSYKNGETIKTLSQFSAFALVCFPLGLWYPVRNLLLFDQPIGYVAKLAPDSALYVGQSSLVERFLVLSLPDMLQNVYCDPFTDVRLLEYTVKCALFGEFKFAQQHNVFAVILIISSLILILVSLVAMIWFVFVDRKKNRFAVISLSALWLLLIVSFIFFNIKYPFGCTMDFRYIVPTVITGAAFCGLFFDALSYERHKRTLAVFIAILVVFCAASAGFYLI